MTPLTPRLLTDRGAADYLSIPLASVARLDVGRVSVDGKLRFDRVAIDRWLDGEPAPAKVSAPLNENVSEADTALAAFKQSHPHAARRRS